ncbi:MAG: hypothetical protein JEZ11_09425 [Desulfobacterales bacterium]|nr:hypothetical protein [Desulfobacterales bacterium]
MNRNTGQRIAGRYSEQGGTGKTIAPEQVRSEKEGDMQRKSIVTVISLLAAFTLGLGVSFGGDLDDGISKANEDGISSYDSMGSADKNVNFIKRNAKSRAKVRAKLDPNSTLTGQTGGGNMNSVVMGAGSNVRGDIYIIDDSKGSKSIVGN